MSEIITNDNREQEVRKRVENSPLLDFTELVKQNLATLEVKHADSLEDYNTSPVIIDELNSLPPGYTHEKQKELLLSNDYKNLSGYTNTSTT